MKQDFPIDDAHRATDPMLKSDPDLQKWVDHYRRMGIAAVVRQWGNYAVDYDGLTRHTGREGYAVFREYSDAEMKSGYRVREYNRRALKRLPSDQSNRQGGFPC